tara:strand:- start:1075 stop:1569 length:495 start_codon:yes stop_codon:yes gene_type:complete
MATKEKKRKNLLKILDPATKWRNPVEHAKMGGKIGTSIIKKGLSTANKARKAGWNKGKKVVSDVNKQSKKVLEEGKKTLSKVNTATKKYNPASDANKKIREKEKIIKSKDSTRGEKAKAKSQKSATIRKRDNIKIGDLQAKRKQEMRDRARRRHKAWKEARKKK